MIETIDLNRHAVFEASAGTGKTYTIGKVVLRLLRERICRLENILIVTFTDKATGELKDRLRRELELAVDAGDEAGLFQAALDHFDVASISTIHGFCLRVLQDYAADLGEDAAAEFAHDVAVHHELLRDLQRQDWPRWFGPRLVDALRAAGFDRDGASKFDDSVLDIASRFRPEHGHRLLPENLGSHPDPTAVALRSLTIARLTERRDEVKRRRGVMSFDDLIQRVAQGLDPACNPRARVVLAALRERYQAAIVDEFQDTDSLQWSIFRRIFLEGSKSRLIVVGDPKQAIYGFRGADLPTYFRAVDTLRNEFKAAAYPLSTNWRSSPEMIAALNRFFNEGQFFASATPAYRPVDAAPPEKLRARLSRDDSGRPPITIVDVDEAAQGATARSDFANFAAGEIDRLLYGGPNCGALLEIETSDGRRPLRASDICILVFKRTEANEVVRALSRRNIPFAFYKSGKVRESAEARDLGYVLAALAHPDDDRMFVRALLTMFFRVSPPDLLRQRGVPDNHPARALIDSFRALADDRRWSEFFASLLEDTGILFHDRGGSDHLRRLATLRLLAGRLQFAAYRRNLDLFGLIDTLNAGDANAAIDDDFEPQGTDAPRVRIMTIHTAKGLEFPVVFHLGGFTNPSKPSCVPYRDEKDNLIFDVALLDAAAAKKTNIPARVEAQQLDESRRLYYVALTRAQFKLYLPVLGPKRGSEKNSIAKLIKPVLERSGLENDRTLAERVSGKSLATANSPRRQGPSATDRVSPFHIESLLPKFDESIERRRISVQSFTSLHRLAQRVAADQFGDRPDRNDEAPQHDVGGGDPFRGALFGELIHEIFERVDFAEIAAAKAERDLDAGSTGRLLDASIARYLPRLSMRPGDASVAEQCRRLVRGMVWRALRTPLAPLGGMLCELRPADCLRELEFLFPKTQRDAETETFIKGYMDLVFRWRGKVYLLDWKSNVLPAYDAASLDAAMDELGYRLQYELYCDALLRWLGQSKSGQLGGVLYVFLRGLSGASDGAGVFFAPASAIARR